MLENARAKLKVRDVHVGQVNVAVAVMVLTAAALFLALHEHEDAYTVFTKSLFASGLAMVVFGVGERFWSGRKVKQAGVNPGGAEVTFEDQISTAVSEVNERMNDHTKVINERLFDLEKAVFKDQPPKE
jgi:hypothetical protein